MLLTSTLKLSGVAWIGLAAAIPTPSTKIDAADFAASDTITRDICIIGGGSTGTYSAVQLSAMNKTVMVVEIKNRLGGHTETFIDPITNQADNIGVEIWHDLDIVKNYFAKLDVPLVKVGDGGPSQTLLVDYRTGKVDTNYTGTNFTDALGIYATQLAKYPYVELGFDLPYPVPADLLLPFGDFIKKHAIEDAAQFIFTFAQGLGDLLAQPTLYVFKNFGTGILNDLKTGFLTTAAHDNSVLYEKAQASLGTNVLLESSVLFTDRSSPSCVKIVVQTPAGKKLILAKTLLITIPPQLYNLKGFDLSPKETFLFSEFGNSAYYTGVLRTDGIAGNQSIMNVGTDTLYNLPVLPGVYSIDPTGINGLHNVKFGSPFALPDAQVRAEILSSVKRMQTMGTIRANATVDLEVFSSHTPFELTVPSQAIARGFYKELIGLQGTRNTFYTGAAFHTHDSSLLWQFTETLLPRIAAGGNGTTNSTGTWRSPRG